MLMYIVPHLRMPPSATSWQTGQPFSIGSCRLSLHTRNLTCAAIQPHIAIVCFLNGLHLRNPC